MFCFSKYFLGCFCFVFCLGVCYFLFLSFVFQRSGLTKQPRLTSDSRSPYLGKHRPPRSSCFCLLCHWHLKLKGIYALKKKKNRLSFPLGRWAVVALYLLSSDRAKELVPRTVHCGAPYAPSQVKQVCLCSHSSPITVSETGSRQSRATAPAYCVSPGHLSHNCFPKISLSIV